MSKVEELEKKINDLIKDLEELRGQKKEKYYKPEEGELYWFISEGEVKDYHNYYDTEDIEIFESQDVYKTKEEAEFYLKKEQLLTQYKRYLLDNEEEPVDWENEIQRKYCACCDYGRQIVEVEWDYTYKNQGAIYTTRKESITEFIEKIGELTFIKYILIGEYKEVEYD